MGTLSDPDGPASMHNVVTALTPTERCPKSATVPESEFYLLSPHLLSAQNSSYQVFTWSQNQAIRIC